MPLDFSGVGVLGQAAGDEGLSASVAVGWAIFAIIIVGFSVGVFLNVRKGREEVGAEMELAANRKPYLSDEDLEGDKLDRTLLSGLVLLALIGVALPLYWLYEPSRQEGAVEMFDDTFVRRGERLYTEGAQCIDCHGPAGSGGAAEVPLLNERGEFVDNVTWQAPALDNVLYRYSREEVWEVLQYGRPGSPMAAWGSLGGGPLTDQQLWNIVDYLESIQLPAADAAKARDDEIDSVCAPDADGNCTVEGGRYETLGEALFNLGQDTGFSGGSYACARCHTKGWSYGRPEVAGGGGLGPNLTGGSTLRQFPSFDSMVDFISRGAERGQPYGVAGIAGDGTMPGYGENPNAEEEDSRMSPDQVMLTPEQIAAVVAYERNL